MKINILDATGKKTKEIEAPVFDSAIRLDIIQKIAEVEKLNAMREYAPFWRAGNQTSASGNVKHNRHVWKTDRGKGMSRFPKKKMSRSGERFVWVGAVIPGTRGGRRAHPPKLGGRDRKINRKEMLFGLKSALAMICSPEMVAKKYSRLNGKKMGFALPLVIESKMLSLNTRDFFSAIGKILGEAAAIAEQKKDVRAGIGKMRGRKYKKSAGLLLVIGNKENKKVKGIDIKKAGELDVRDIASNGARLAVFTEEAVKNIGERLE